MKSLYLAAGLALVALPANAAVQPAQSHAAAKAAKTAQPAQPANQTKYCLTYEPMIGSRIAASECKTNSDWAKLGVDVDELLKK